MSKPVLSPEWMQEYADLWNGTPATREGTSELDMIIDFRLAEDETRGGRVKIVKGEAVETGDAEQGSQADLPDDRHGGGLEAARLGRDGSDARADGT